MLIKKPKVLNHKFFVVSSMNFIPTLGFQSTLQEWQNNTASSTINSFFDLLNIEQ